MRLMDRRNPRFLEAELKKVRAELALAQDTIDRDVRDLGKLRDIIWEKK